MSRNPHLATLNWSWGPRAATVWCIFDVRCAMLEKYWWWDIHVVVHFWQTNYRLRRRFLLPGEETRKRRFVISSVRFTNQRKKRSWAYISRAADVPVVLLRGVPCAHAWAWQFLRFKHCSFDKVTSVCQLVKNEPDALLCSRRTENNQSIFSLATCIRSQCMRQTLASRKRDEESPGKETGHMCLPLNSKN